MQSRRPVAALDRSRLVARALRSRRRRYRLRELVWWMGVAAAAVGVGTLVYTIWPRTGDGDHGRVRYFADVRTHERCETLISDLNDEAARKSRDAEQLLALVPIVWRKYIAIKAAISALTAGAVLIVTAVVIG